MKDSLIIGLIVSLFNKILRLYDDSFLDRIIKSVCDYFKKGSENSFVCSLFTGRLFDGSYFKNSITFKIVTFPIWVIKKISFKIGDTFKNAINNSEFINIINNFTKIPLKEVGVIALSYTIGMIITLFIAQKMTKNMIILSIIMIFASLILLAIPTSFAKTCSESKVIGFFAGVFNRYTMTENSEKTTDDVFHIKSKRAFSAIAVVAGAVTGLVNAPVAILAVICAIAVIVVLNNCFAGVLLTVFLSPVMPTLACVGLVLLTAFSFLVDLIKNKSKKYVLTSMDFFILAFLFLQGFSAFTSFNVENSIPVFIVSFVFAMEYFIIVNTVKTKNEWYNMVLLFVFAGVIVSVIGIYQNFFMGVTNTGWIDEDMFEDITTRVYSTFDNPNILGQYLILVIPVAFACMWGNKKAKDKLILMASVAVMAACLIFTWSRAAWVGVVLSIGFYLLMKDRRWITVGIIALLLMPFVLPESILSRITSIGNLGDSSTAYRVSVWIASARMAIDYILSGIGPGVGAFERVYQNYALNGAGFALHSHNFYIQLVVEMGIFALITFLLIIFVSYKEIISLKAKNTAVKNVSLAIGGALVGYMFAGVAESLWYNYRMILIFFTVLGILQSGINTSKSEKVYLEIKEKQGEIR